MLRGWLSVFKVAQLSPTLCNPMDCNLPGFSIHGILQARVIWSGLPFPSPGDLPNPGIEPGSPALEVDALTSEPSGKPKAKYPFICCCCSVSHVLLFATPWTAACQSSLSSTISKSLLKLMSIESVMPSNHSLTYHLWWLLYYNICVDWLP